MSDPNPDRRLYSGAAPLSLILLVFAFVCAVIFTAMAADWITFDKPLVFAGLWASFLTAAFIF